MGPLLSKYPHSCTSTLEVRSSAPPETLYTTQNTTINVRNAYRTCAQYTTSAQVPPGVPHLAAGLGGHAAGTLLAASSSDSACSCALVLCGLFSLQRRGDSFAAAFQFPALTKYRPCRRRAMSSASGRASSSSSPPLPSPRCCSSSSTSA